MSGPAPDPKTLVRDFDGKRDRALAAVSPSAKSKVEDALFAAFAAGFALAEDHSTLAGAARAAKEMSR